MSDVQDEIKTIQQKRFDILKDIAFQRGHFVVKGEDGTNRQVVTMYCPLHDSYQEVMVGN